MNVRLMNVAPEVCTAGAARPGGQDLLLLGVTVIAVEIIAVAQAVGHA